MEVEHKRRTATQRRKKKDSGPEIRLGEQDINRTQKQTKDVTTSNVRAVSLLLWLC